MSAFEEDIIGTVTAKLLTKDYDVLWLSPLQSTRKFKNNINLYNEDEDGNDTLPKDLNDIINDLQLSGRTLILMLHITPLHTLLYFDNE